MENRALREYVRARAEDRPGVYRMLGSREELLYVGKSVRVRSRLLSYFRADAGEKAARIVGEAVHIDWEYVPNEFSALLREMRLIQRWQPPYNVEHRRRRSYAFLKITREPAPRVLPVSRVREDGATYFGPFPRVGRLGESVRVLSRVLGLRDCPAETPILFDDQLEIFGGGRPPRCLRGATGSCLAPCAGGCSAREYGEGVEAARRFLEGRSRRPLRILEERMAEAVARLDFEYAALLRDRHELLATLQQELVAFRGRVAGLTFVYRLPGFRGDDRLYLIRNGLVQAELPRPRSREERLRVARKVEEVFGEGAPPPRTLTPEAAAEILLVARWFRLRKRELRRTLPPREWCRRRSLPVSTPHQTR